VSNPIPPGWQVLINLPTDLVPTRLLPLDGGLLIAGWLGGFAAPADERRAVVLHVSLDPEPLLQTRYEADGWIAWADRYDGGAHAVRLTGVSSSVSRRLLYSDDDGLTWIDRGPIGGSSALRVLSRGPQEAWIQGAGALLVTRDGGDVWRVLNAPGDRDPVADRLFSVGDRVILAAQEHTFVTRDGGRSWGRRPLGPIHVRAVDGAYLAARAGDQTLIGRPRGQQILWLGRIDTTLDPLELRVSPPRVQLLATRVDPEEGPRLVLVESADGGASITATRLGVPPGEGWAALAHDGAVFAVDPERQLLMKPWAG